MGVPDKLGIPPPCQGKALAAPTAIRISNLQSCLLLRNSILGAALTGSAIAAYYRVKLCLQVNRIVRAPALAYAVVCLCASAMFVTNAAAQTPAQAREVAAVRAAAAGNSGAQSPGQSAANWLAQVRACVAAHDLSGAQKIIDARLVEAPTDSDALGWRARILMWNGDRAEAELAYRQALKIAPRDADLLVELARLYAQQNHDAAALELLDAAVKIPPPRADVLAARGRVLAALGRSREARADFLQARALEPASISPSDDEAAAGLRALRAASDAAAKFELSFGNETDAFNYTNAANTQTVTLIAKPNARWIFSTEADSYQRFGALAQKFLGAATLRIGRADSLTVRGGGSGNADGIIPRAETFAEYGHGFRISERGALRGIEFAYNNRWLWYAGAHVMVLTGTAAADFADGFRWTVSANGARSGFAGTPVAWKPAGYARFDFPLPHVNPDRLLLNTTFAVGTENFGELDQVGAFASRTFGGGARIGLTGRQRVTFYAGHQIRNGGNTENIFGASYGVRF
jgi:tetratricopeptide (TPR) repeat protein